MILDDHSSMVSLSESVTEVFCASLTIPDMHEQYICQRTVKTSQGGSNENQPL
jgi:hypothetical protein